MGATQAIRRRSKLAHLSEGPAAVAWAVGVAVGWICTAVVGLIRSILQAIYATIRFLVSMTIKTVMLTAAVSVFVVLVGSIVYVAGSTASRRGEVSEACLYGASGQPVFIDQGRLLRVSSGSSLARYQMLCDGASTRGMRHRARMPSECLFDEAGGRVLYRQRVMRRQGDFMFDAEWAARCG